MDEYGIIFIVVAVGLLLAVINYWMFSAQEAAWRQFAKQTGLVCEGISLLGYQLRVRGQYRNRDVEVVAYRNRSGSTTAKTPVHSPIWLEIGIYPSDTVASAVRNFAGKKQIKVDDAVLNKRYAFFASDEVVLRKWLALSTVSSWLTEAIYIYGLEVKNGWVELQQPGISRNVDELTWMLDLVTGLAQEFEKLQAASEQRVQPVNS